MASPKGLLMLLSLFLIAFSGVRWQVLRKRRTSFARSTHVEDSEFRNSTRYRVIAGAETTGGEYFVVEALVRPGAYGVWRGGGPAGGSGLSSAPAPARPQRPGSEPPHSHAFQTEVVVVKSGMLGYWKGPRGGDDADEAGDPQQQQGGPQQGQHPQPAARRRPAPGRGRTGVAGPGDAVVFAPGEPHSWWNAGVSDPNAAPSEGPKVGAKSGREADKRTKKQRQGKNKGSPAGKGEEEEQAGAPAPPAATAAEPGELLVQVVTWPAGPAGERLYETLAGLGHDYGSPLAVGPAQRALTYGRAAARLETVAPEAWLSAEAWALPALEALGYRGLYAKYASDLARAADLDAAAQAYAEARSAEEGGGASAHAAAGVGAGGGGGGGGGGSQTVRAELISATMQGKEARRAKLDEISRKRKAQRAQEGAAVDTDEVRRRRAAAGGEGEGSSGGGGGGSAEGGDGELPPARRTWHASADSQRDEAEEAKGQHGKKEEL